MELLSKVYARSGVLHRLVHPVLDFVLRGDRTWKLPIWAGPLKGMVLDLNLEWEREFLLADYETGTVETLERLVKPGMTCYDVGAHVGYFTLLMAKLTGPTGQVIAVEPNPPIMARLQGNVLRNQKRVGAKVSFQQCAVSDEVGQLRFFKGGATTTGRLDRIPQDALATDIFQVECVTLDSLVYAQGLAKPDFIKVDVEYVEDRAMKGALRILNEFHPILVCEIHDIGSGERVWEYLKNARYVVYSVEQGNEWRTLSDVTRGHVFASPIGNQD